MPHRITKVKPREQAGARTGRKYEVQYEEAALACLKLLEEGEATCVYCEWHDDYVVERRGASETYAFHQVKTRSDAQGAWSMLEILGVKKARSPKGTKQSRAKVRKTGGRGERTDLVARQPEAAPTPSERPKLELRAKDGIAHRMLDNFRKFADACAVFVFVSPVEVAADPFLDLVSQCRSATSPIELSTEPKLLFDELVAAYRQRDESTTEAEVWGLLARLDFARASASESNAQVAIGLMGQMIHELSEVDVTVTEQGRIASALLKVVRERSHTELDDPLPDDDDVRACKAVALPEVIKLLPLSLEGYNRLKAGEKQVVKSLSRLQRLCRNSGMDERMIVIVCELKVEWHAWKAQVGDSLTPDTLAVLREAGLGLLKSLTNSMTSTPFQDLLTSADREVLRLAIVSTMPTAINARVLMGLAFALAAESE